MNTFFRLLRDNGQWFIDTGRGSPLQGPFSLVNIQAIGKAEADFDFITFDDAVLIIDDTVATLIQGS